MRIIIACAGLATALALGACTTDVGAPPPAGATGNMAYPAPNRTGSYVTTPGSSAPAQQTGNMAYPAPRSTGIVP